MLRLKEAKLIVNLTKSEFRCTNFVFLGHLVGQGQIKPVDAKVKAVASFPIPSNKKQLMQFLGMTGQLST